MKWAQTRENSAFKYFNLMFMKGERIDYFDWNLCNEKNIANIYFWFVKSTEYFE